MKKAKATKKKTANKQRMKVWRIFRFGERYELPEDMKICRKSGLQYTRDFVSCAGGDEAVGYQKQFGMISNGDGLELYLLYGIYRKLINISAELSRAKRGFLLDAADQPLTDTQIGRLLNIKSKPMQRILHRLESVKLLEKVELPDFDMSLNDPPEKKSEKGSARNSSENSGKFRKPFKKRQKGKEVKQTKEQQKATNGLSAVVAKENNNGRGNRVTSNSVKARANSRARQKKTTTAPTTAPPTEPQGSDAGDSRVIQFSDPRSVYSRAAEQYGRRVYIALGLTWDIDSIQARREIGSFASKFERSRSELAGAPPPMLDDLWRRGIAEARRIAKRGSKSRNVGAVWNKAMNNMIAAYKRRAM